MEPAKWEASKPSSTGRETPFGWNNGRLEASAMAADAWRTSTFWILKVLYKTLQNRIHGTGKSQLSAWCHYLAGLAQAWSLIAATRQSCFENLLVDFQELSSSVPAVLCKAHWQGLSKQDVVSAMSKLWNFISLPYEYNAGKHDPLQTSGHVVDP